MADDDLKRARLRGKRAALGLLIGVTTVFIGLSAHQIVPQVFGWGARAVEASPSGGAVEGGCAAGVDRLARAVERAAARVIGAPDEATAVERYRAGLSPEWDRQGDVEAACRGAPRGLEAHAAVQRLRLAEEGLARRRGIEIGPVRRDVEARLPR